MFDEVPLSTGVFGDGSFIGAICAALIVRGPLCDLFEIPSEQWGRFGVKPLNQRRFHTFLGFPLVVDADQFAGVLADAAVTSMA